MHLRWQLSAAAVGVGPGTGLVWRSSVHSWGGRGGDKCIGGAGKACACLQVPSGQSLQDQVPLLCWAGMFSIVGAGCGGCW